MDKNTQQPVAWIGERGLPEFVAGAPKLQTGTRLYTSPPVPRYVLMDLAKSVESELITGGYVALTESQLSTIADRYASQVQHSCKNCEGIQPATCAFTCDYPKPDPVNQQLLAALEPFAKAHETWNGGNAPLHFSTAAVPAHFRRAAYVYRSAIAAAEKEQGHD